MRRDPTSSRPTAREVLADIDEGDLRRLIWAYGEERWAPRIAATVARERAARPIETSGQLARLIEGAIPRAAWPPKTHPATRTFQAIRIVVNDELAGLEGAIKSAVAFLAPGGRLAVITFHSLEDRIVKHAFRRLSVACTCPPDMPECRCTGVGVARLITKKAIVASDAEVASNPPSRSAKLRILEKA